MKEDIRTYVERYIDGGMTESEIVLFGKELESNSELRRELELQRDLIATLKASADIDLKKQLKAEWNKSQGNEPQEKTELAKVKTIGYYLTRIAATLLIMLGAWFAWMNWDTPQEQVFAAPNTPPIIAKKYTNPSSSSQSIELFAFESTDQNWKYSFKSEKLTLVVPEHIKVDEDSFKFKFKEGHNMDMIYNGKVYPIIESTELKLLEIE